MTLTELEKISFPLLLSLLLHVILLLLFSYLATSLPQFTLFPAPEFKPLTIREIKPAADELQKIRTVGKKDGRKEFSRPLKQSPPQPPAPAVSLSDLQAPIKPQIAPTEKPTAASKPKTGAGNKQIKQWTVSTPEQGQKQKAKMQEAFQVSPEQMEVLDIIGFGFQFEPPEGVSEDELNSLEKIYYSFFKRVYETYVRSFLTTYNRLSLSRPNLKHSLKEESHLLRGRVIFDQQGNILTISILKSTHSDDIHTLFEETLKSMRAVPNPPQDLVQNRPEFNIYYQLQINQ